PLRRQRHAPRNTEMAGEESVRERALVATGEELLALMHHPSADVLLALLDNPALDETQVCLLLGRKDLPGEVLEEVARRKPLLKSYRVKRALAFHPRAPRLASLRLLRDLYLMDLVQIAMLVGVSAELLAEGHAQVTSVVLDNPYLTEAQILKALPREKLPASVVPAIIQHRKWSLSYNVRLALVRHTATPLATILSYLPQLTVSDLRELAEPGIVPESLRKYLQAEVQRRPRAGGNAYWCRAGE